MDSLILFSMHMKHTHRHTAAHRTTTACQQLESSKWERDTRRAKYDLQQTQKANKQLMKRQKITSAIGNDKMTINSLPLSPVRMQYFPPNAIHTHVPRGDGSDGDSGGTHYTFNSILNPFGGFDCSLQHINVSGLGSEGGQGWIWVTFLFNQ